MAVLPLFKGFTENVLQMLQSQWSTSLNPVISNALLGGNQVNGIVLTTSPLAVPHGLAQTMKGYIITSQNASASVWMTGSFNASTVTLQASASVTVNLWCY